MCKLMMVYHGIMFGIDMVGRRAFSCVLCSMHFVRLCPVIEYLKKYWDTD